ncbi:MAG: SHOCT domain-containing protein [Chloroflexi bacterium]|nr:MAG: SHOCT domain-containing protein [Chloroflexota bacterium]
MMGGGMMGGFGGFGGLGILGMLINLVIWIGLLALIVYGVVWAVRQLGGGDRVTYPAAPGEGRLPATQSAEEILKARLARGEIDEDTYERLRQRLQS